MARFHIGLSGYSYKPWQGEGRFYPPELKAREFLGYYASRFSAVEMDGTWYRMPAENMVQTWIEATPRDFFFSPKMHRDVTHMKRLKPESYDSARFFVHRLEPLARAGKLGPILVQLPPNLKADPSRLAAFLSALPRLIGGGDPSLLATPLRYAVEFRNSTWESDEIEQLLRANNVVWVAADTDEAEAQRRDTGDFVYVRLRRSEYDDARLQGWADYFRSVLGSGKDCFVYCKHEDEGSQWIWADRLSALVAR
jgi:uncharacterized protein YecE (DUF72 family)